MRVCGVVRPPGDKSVTHRALILGGLFRAPVEVTHALTAADARSTARVLRQLGVRVGSLRAGRRVRIEGGDWKPPAEALHCGNSGTTARLMLGALAGHAFAARVTGDASLRRRPMRRVTDPLTMMGAEVVEHRGDRLPVTIRGGALHGIEYATPVASAQVKSAILLAALTGGVRVTVTEPARSRDHTERLLGFLGVDVAVRGTSVALDGASFRAVRQGSIELEVPGDLSSAAYLLAAAVLAEGGDLAVQGVGVNPTRTGFLEVLARMGATVRREGTRERGGEPVADLLVTPAQLHGTEVTPEEVPGLIDEVPILAMLAARGRGVTRFRGVGELRVKESDRLALLARNLRAVGGRAEVAGDDLSVEGVDVPPRGRVETGGDHRIAMAFAVLGTVRGGGIALSETASVAVSYPGFFDDLERIRGA